MVAKSAENVTVQTHCIALRRKDAKETNRGFRFAEKTKKNYKAFLKVLSAKLTTIVLLTFFAP